MVITEEPVVITEALVVITEEPVVITEEPVVITEAPLPETPIPLGEMINCFAQTNKNVRFREGKGPEDVRPAGKYAIALGGH